MIPYSGVIEGFFGREWSWADRASYAGFLADNRFDFYIYAPKADPYLRHSWSQDWPEETWVELRALREIYREKRVAFGIGLSPFDVQQNFSAEARRELERKADRINDLEPDILCILYDDMKGDVSNLASIQAVMAHLLVARSTASRHIVCPSYYSDDPVLEKVFGKAPENYLDDLGRLLDPKLDIFWTGPLVCSEEYPREHLLEVGQRLRRKPFLWDNYPVNDGAKKSNHLYLKPFRHHDLSDLVSGHAVNPMNQASLSRLPLLTLEASHQSDYSAARALSEALEKECPDELVVLLKEHIPNFAEHGLSGIETAAYADRYRTLPEHPYRTEILDWLEGRYEFDPACLTD